MIVHELLAIDDDLGAWKLVTMYREAGTKVIWANVDVDGEMKKFRGEYWISSHPEDKHFYDMLMGRATPQKLAEEQSKLDRRAEESAREAAADEERVSAWRIADDMKENAAAFASNPIKYLTDKDSPFNLMPEWTQTLIRGAIGVGIGGLALIAAYYTVPPVVRMIARSRASRRRERRDEDLLYGLGDSNDLESRFEEFLKGQHVYARELTHHSEGVCRPIALKADAALNRARKLAKQDKHIAASFLNAAAGAYQEAGADCERRVQAGPEMRRPGDKAGSFALQRYGGRMEEEAARWAHEEE